MIYGNKESELEFVGYSSLNQRVYILYTKLDILEKLKRLGDVLLIRPLRPNFNINNVKEELIGELKRPTLVWQNDSLINFLNSSYKQERFKGRDGDDYGKDKKGKKIKYSDCVIKSASEDVVKYGHTLISHHDNVYGEAVWFYDKAPQHIKELNKRGL